MSAPFPSVAARLAAFIDRRWPDFRGDRPLVALFFVALAMAACLARAEPDTFWQLRAGADIVASGRVLLVDHYSYTAAGQPWPDHEWLWQVATYLAHAGGGMPLLTAVAASLTVATFALTYAVTAGSTRSRLAWLAVSVLLGGAPWSVRPHLFTDCALAFTLWCVLRGRLWPLPPLFLLWANVHGAVVLGLVVLGGAFIATLAGGAPSRARPLALVTAACAAATLATPLGAGLYGFIAESMEKSRTSGIREWQPAISLAPRTVAFWAASLVLVGSAARLWRRIDSREDRTAVVVALLFVPLGLRAVRNIVPFAILLAPAASRLWAIAAPPPRRTSVEEGTPAAHVRAVAAVALGGAVFVAIAWSVPFAMLRWTPMSAGAAAAVRACPGQLYNHYNQGGPLIWFVPERPVFIDGRQDPYPLSFVRRAAALPSDDADRRAVFREYGIHCAALPPASGLPARLIAEGWRQRYRDAEWVVLADR